MNMKECFDVQNSQIILRSIGNERKNEILDKLTHSYLPGICLCWYSRKGRISVSHQLHRVTHSQWYP